MRNSEGKIKLDLHRGNAFMDFFGLRDPLASTGWQLRLAAIDCAHPTVKPAFVLPAVLSFTTRSHFTNTFALRASRRLRVHGVVSTQRQTPTSVETSAPTVLDPPASPSLFPILSQKIHGKPLVYLDSAATSQKPASVIDALTSYYENLNSNVHRGAHALAAKATDAFEETRALIAAFINSSTSDEVIYTRNATEAINLVASTWGRANLQPGDAVAVSVMEHHANLVPWQMIAQEMGATIVPIPLTSDQTYDIDALRAALEMGNIKIVACSHVSNVLGCVNPVPDIAALAHQHGALVLLDACQSVPHMRVNVQQLNVDFLVASAHKMCGPTGVGFLWGRREVLEAMPPFLGGGEMIVDVWLDRSTYASIPHKFEAGTPAIGEVVAFAEAIRFLNGLDMGIVKAFEEDIGTYLWESLTAFKEVTVYGPPPPRAALCSFNVDNIHSSDLATMLDLEGVAVRSGHHCAQPLHRSLGVNSSARASLYIYNTREEVDAFISALKDSVEILGGTLTAIQKPT